MESWPSKSPFNRVILQANGLFIFIKILVLALEKCRDPEDCLKEPLLGISVRPLLQYRKSAWEECLIATSTADCAKILGISAVKYFSDCTATRTTTVPAREAQTGPSGCATTTRYYRPSPRRRAATATFFLRRPHGHDPATIAPANCTQAVSKRRTSTTGSPGALRWECSDMGLRPQQQQATTRPRIERQPTNPFTRPPGRRM